MILNAVQKGYRINHKMIVQMVGLIQMRGNDHLILFAPELFSQLHANLMRQLRSSFTGSKGLITVVSYGAILFAELPLHCQHFFTSGSGMTVDARNKLLHDISRFVCRLSFLIIYRIVNDIRKSLHLPV